MSFGSTDWSWLSDLFSSNTAASMPNVTAGASPSAWAPQPTFASETPPMGAGMNPEMGGGAARLTGLNTVDALGPNGTYVNAASSVAHGLQPTFADKLNDMLGINGPGGMSQKDLNRLLQTLMMQQQAFSRQRPAPPQLGPMQDFSTPVQPAGRPMQRPQIPVYPWSRPRGLLE